MTSDFRNYWPGVAQQLLKQWKETTCLTNCVFRRNPRTESALLRLTKDILMSVDSGNQTIVILLDLGHRWSHDFTKQTHESGSALTWFASYVSNREFKVTTDTFSSSAVLMSCGVPQGSVLGPVVFSLYLWPLGHFPPTVTLMTLSCFSHLALKITTVWILCCLAAIKDWMASSFWYLNTDQMEVLIIGSDHISNSITSTLDH